MPYHMQRLTLMAGAVLLASACGDTTTAPEGTEPSLSESELSATRYMQVGSSVAWNKTARQLIVDRGVAATGPTQQLRILAYLSLAQYNAVVTAEATRHRATQASPAAAAAGASVVVLTSFFPADAAFLEATLDAQFPAASQGGGKAKHEDLAWGEEVGRAVGADVVAYAASDNFNQAIPIQPPPGPGIWTSSANPPAPSFRALYGTRPFFLTSADQFRSVPPPAFGSPAFLTDLAEIRTLSDTRTPEQLAEAQFWAPKAAVFMNEVATGMIEKYDRKERGAAHILALANMAAFDAHIGCWDAKFAYWYIRPPQADAGITLPIGLPNHPSYISGHSCNTASYATVLTRAFPPERALLESYITRAGLSRMYAGIHYRFDITAGQVLGREVGNWVLRHDVRGHRPFPLD